jgi:phosphatidylglycerol:prolipoprotein diacylglycerol transferase
MSIGFCFGISLGIRDRTMRTLARALSFVPPLVAYLALKPPTFGSSVSVMLSTSQWIALISALLVSYFYAQYWAAAQQSPALAMSLGLPGSLPPPSREAEEEDADDEEDREPAEARDVGKTAAEAPISKRKKQEARGRKAAVPPEASVQPPEADEAPIEEAKP